jgi:hypothetical protein
MQYFYIALINITNAKPTLIMKYIGKFLYRRYQVFMYLPLGSALI